MGFSFCWINPYPKKERHPIESAHPFSFSFKSSPFRGGFEEYTSIRPVPLQIGHISYPSFAGKGLILFFPDEHDKKGIDIIKHTEKNKFISPLNLQTPLIIFSYNKLPELKIYEETLILIYFLLRPPLTICIFLIIIFKFGTPRIIGKTYFNL